MGTISFPLQLASQWPLLAGPGLQLGEAESTCQTPLELWSSLVREKAAPTSVSVLLAFSANTCETKKVDNSQLPKETLPNAPFGSTISVVCADGFSDSDSASTSFTATCTEDGTWEMTGDCEDPGKRPQNVSGSLCYFQAPSMSCPMATECRPNTRTSAFSAVHTPLLTQCHPIQHTPLPGVVFLLMRGVNAFSLLSFS